MSSQMPIPFLILMVLWFSCPNPGCGSGDGEESTDMAAADQSATGDASSGDTTAGEDALGTDQAFAPDDTGDSAQEPDSGEVLEDTSEVTVLDEPPVPKPYSGGVCPLSKAGKNTFESDGRPRSFELYLPDDPTGASLVFVWHGLGDTPKNIAMFFQGESAAKQHHAIIVAPYDCCADGNQDCCSNLFPWNIGEYSDGQADLAVFDDVISCLDQQFDIDNSRIYSTGFSLGCVWTTYLLMHRSEYLAAVAIFSGGVGSLLDYQAPAYDVPALLVWGGAGDTYMGVVSFRDRMVSLSEHLQEDGHFVVECDHGLGHTVPYGGATWAYEFLFAHSWGESSPYPHLGLSDEFPKYCSIP